MDGISDLRDESSRAGMRIVIELKKDVNANVVLNNLYKHTQLQDTFGVIMIALVNGEPKVLNLREMLYHYIAHQKDVVTRRTQFDLDKARERLHILEGLMIALDNIDEVIAIIKASANGAEAKERLIARFGFSERQAQAILDMRLQRLTGLEREKLEAEYGELKRTVEYLASLLADEGKLMGVVKDEMLEFGAALPIRAAPKSQRSLKTSIWTTSSRKKTWLLPAPITATSSALRKQPTARSAEAASASAREQPVKRISLRIFSSQARIPISCSSQTRAALSA